MTFAHTAAQSLTLRLQLPETPFALFYHSPTHATFLAFITRHNPVPVIPRHWGLRADGTAWCQQVEATPSVPEAACRAGVLCEFSSPL